MTFSEDIVQRIVADASATGCLAELRRELAEEVVRRIDLGADAGKGAPAKELLRIYRVREWTTTQAQASTYGFPQTLEALASQPPNATVLLSAFSTANRLFVVFAEETGKIIGCLGVEKRKWGIGLDLKVNVMGPREFKDEAGRVAFTGTVFDTDGSPEREPPTAMLMRVHQPFIFRGESWDNVVVSARYEQALLDFLPTGPIACNVVRVPSERLAEPFDTSWWRGQSALVGTVERAP